MLFLGNSYTFYNDLDQRVAELFAAAGEAVEAERVANGGWRFVDHLEAIDAEGTPSAEALTRAHTWFVLQEQSQIPGFPQTQRELRDSLAAAVELDARAAGNGAGTLFLMTWGRRDGDSTNPDRYPDFPTMSALLDEGYLAYAAAASEDGSPAYVAPAGRAWTRVYEDVLAEGGDPLAAGSAFHGLYDADGSHPSPRGSFLTACVVYASLSGASPQGLPAPGDVPDAEYLAGVAADVVLNADDLTFPWTADAPEDTGGADSGGADSGTADSGDAAADSGDEDDVGGGAAEGGGCGCAAAGGAGREASLSAWWSGAAWLLLVGLLVRRRR
jgi:hypothetical protein